MQRKFPLRPETEVFVNQQGNIAIVQKEYPDESVVWFEPEQVDTLIEWLKDAKREREEEWEPDEVGQGTEP